MEQTVWVFHGAQAQFTSAIFTERALAEKWIAENKFSGMLTEYPLNISVYDLHMQTGKFTPKTDAHKVRKFRQNFTSASQPHFHYTDGVR